MIALDKIQCVYFLGIGGMGMSSLARFFNQQGKEVYGYDLTETPLTQQLIKEGMQVHYEDNTDLIPEQFFEVSMKNLVIYTPAIPSIHQELNQFLKGGIKVYKRSEILGFISQQCFSIAIAGTHGKTTTSSILTHLLHAEGEELVAFLGGVLQGRKTNFIGEEGVKLNPFMYCVLEADEYDRSFLHLHPKLGVITNCDADHLDIYKTPEEMYKAFKAFISNIASEGTLIINEKAAFLLDTVRDDMRCITYGFGANNDVCVHDINFENNISHFSLTWAGQGYENLSINMLGAHNTLNAAVAVIVLLLQNISIENVIQHLATFEGVDRRMNVLFDEYPKLYLDDYAHHPIELYNLIGTVQKMRPDEGISIVFQPHLYSRTNDFAADFAKELSRVDRVYLMDIYPARELPIKGVTSKVIGEKIQNAEVIYVSKKDLLRRLEKDMPTVLLSVGAGDIGHFTKEINALYHQQISI